MNNTLERAFSVIEGDSEKLKHERRHEQLQNVRLAIHGFLEHPRGLNSFVYNCLVFTFIVVTHTLATLAESDPTDLIVVRFARQTEFLLASFFYVEFIIRIWSLGANARYAGWSGFVRYAKTIPFLIDVMILASNVGIFLMGKSNLPSQVVELIRFLQLFRLLHVDREFSTWKMVFLMVKRNLKGLSSLYLATAVVFCFFAYGVYEMEYVYWKGRQVNASSTDESPFSTYADSYWFSIVTILTVGYGDIVPKYWMSKIYVIFAGFIGITLFAASASLVGVGMSLMVENESKNQQKKKIRNIAATTIQHWYRWQLISDYDRFMRIPKYRELCTTLKGVEKRMDLAREITKKAAEKKRNRLVADEKLGPLGSTINRSFNDTRRSSIAELGLSAFIRDPLLRQIEDPFDSKTPFLYSPKPIQRKISLAELPPSSPGPLSQPRRRISQPNLLSPILPNVLERFANFRPLLTSSQPSIDTLDISDDEDIINFQVQCTSEQSLDTIDAQAKFERLFNLMIDDKTSSRYRPLLLMLYFFLFLLSKRKFKSSRKPYDYAQAEDELSDMQYHQVQKFRELELHLHATLGSLGTSEATTTDTVTGEHRNISDRLQAVEDAIRSLDVRFDQIIAMSLTQLEVIQRLPPGPRL